MTDREHLYRGKRADNNEWVEGNHLYDEITDKHYIVPFGNINESQRVGEEGCCYCVGFEVIPETVGQYIGRDDKNGKKIFDGTILKGYTYPFYASDDNTFNYYAVVIWLEETCSYRLVTIKSPDTNRRGISEGNDNSFEEFQSEDWEIIGNVHDNPELLPEWIMSWL